ncbi:hypothetical protein BDF14DRAFT_1728573, partial [Spinellus fusiger]
APASFQNRQVFTPLSHIKIGTIQRRLAWPLHKDDTKLLRWNALRSNFFGYFSSLLF